MVSKLLTAELERVIAPSSKTSKVVDCVIDAVYYVMTAMCEVRYLPSYVSYSSVSPPFI